MHLLTKVAGCVADSNAMGDSEQQRSGYVGNPTELAAVATINLCVEPASNVGPGYGDEFMKAAQLGAEARLARGFDAQGNIGGEFSSDCPPPGFRFKGYHKGCTGIVWEAIPHSTRDGPGHCSRCGFSLYHYAGTVSSPDSI